MLNTIKKLELKRETVRSVAVKAGLRTGRVSLGPNESCVSGQFNSRHINDNDGDLTDSVGGSSVATQ